MVVAKPWPLVGYNYPVPHKGRDDASMVAGRPIRSEPNPAPAPIIRPIDFSKMRLVPSDIPKRNNMGDDGLWDGDPVDTHGRMIGTDEIFDDIPAGNVSPKMDADELPREASQGLAAVFMNFASPMPDQTE